MHSITTNSPPRTGPDESSNHNTSLIPITTDQENNILEKLSSVELEEKKISAPDPNLKPKNHNIQKHKEHSTLKTPDGTTTTSPVTSIVVICDRYNYSHAF